MRLRRRGRDVAGNLRRRDRLGKERERHRRLVAGLQFKRRVIDGAAVEPGGRSGLQAAHAKTESIEPVAQPNSRGFPHATGRDASLAHMDYALQERAGGDDHGSAAKFAPAGRDDTRYSAIHDYQVLDRLLDHIETML